MLYDISRLDRLNYLKTNQNHSSSRKTHNNEVLKYMNILFLKNIKDEWYIKYKIVFGYISLVPLS